MVRVLKNFKAFILISETKQEGLPGEGRMIGIVSYVVYDPVATQKVIDDYFLSVEGFKKENEISDTEETP